MISKRTLEILRRVKPSDAHNHTMCIIPMAEDQGFLDICFSGIDGIIYRVQSEGGQPVEYDERWVRVKADSKGPLPEVLRQPREIEELDAAVEGRDGAMHDYALKQALNQIREYRSRREENAYK